MDTCTISGQHSCESCDTIEDAPNVYSSFFLNLLQRCFSSWFNQSRKILSLSMLSLHGSARYFWPSIINPAVNSSTRQGVLRTTLLGGQDPMPVDTPIINYDYL